MMYFKSRKPTFFDNYCPFGAKRFHTIHYVGSNFAMEDEDSTMMNTSEREMGQVLSLESKQISPFLGPR